MTKSVYSSAGLHRLKKEDDDEMQNTCKYMQVLSLAIPSWVGAMSTSQRAVMPCGSGVKVGMVRVCVAGKTV